MNIKQKVTLIAGIIIFIIYFATIAIFVQQIKINNKKIIELTDKLKQYESVELPCKEEIDSIKNNISHKDDIINQIKIDYIKDVEWIKNMPDSSAINLFNQLIWTGSNANR